MDANWDRPRAECQALPGRAMPAMSSADEGGLQKSRADSLHPARQALAFLLAALLDAPVVAACPGDRGQEWPKEREQWSESSLTLLSVLPVSVTGPEAAAGVHKGPPLRRLSAQC